MNVFDIAGGILMDRLLLQITAEEGCRLYV